MTFFRKIVVASAAIACALLPAAFVAAQSVAQPSVVVALSPLSNQLDDIGYLTAAAGVPAFGNIAKVQVDAYSRGIDKTRPIGILLFVKDANTPPDSLACIPVDNFDDLLNTVSNIALVEDEDDCSVIKPEGGPEIYVKEINKHAVIAQSKEMFASVPSDLGAVLGNLPSRYNVSTKVFAQRIPAEMREQFLSMIESSYREQIEQMSSDELASELQMKNFELQMKEMRSLINETDELVVGLDFDKEQKNIHLDIEMTGLDGSSLAKRSQQMINPKPSRFGGFLVDGATFTANAHTRMVEGDSEQYSTALDDLLAAAKKKMEEEGEMSAEESEVIKGVIEEFFAMAKETCKNGDIDMGAAVVLDENNANVILGVSVASPAKFENKIKEVAVQAKDKLGEEVQLKLNCETYNGVNFHEIIANVPADEEELSTLVGEKAKVYVGFGKDVVYMAAGSNPMDLLKASMKPSTGSSAGNLLMQYNVFVTPILKKVAQIQGEDQVAKMAEVLAKTGRDRVRMTSNSIKNGVDFRIEIQDGILQLIGAAVGPMMGQMQGDGF